MDWKTMLMTSADRAIVTALALVTAKSALSEVDWAVVASTATMAFLLTLKEHWRTENNLGA